MQYRMLSDEIEPVARPGTYQPRYESVPGELSQHDFGEVDVRFVDGSTRRVRYFVSRLTHSRWAVATLLATTDAETLARTLLDHLLAFGGAPLKVVFDRARTIALEWDDDGTITRWNPLFAAAKAALGLDVEVGWTYLGERETRIEPIGRWIKALFFQARRFADLADLERQLAQWLNAVNGRPVAGKTPRERFVQDRQWLRPLRITPDRLVLRVPVRIDRTATVIVGGHTYELPPAACGLDGTMSLHADRVVFQVGPTRYELPREGDRAPATTPSIRAARLAAVPTERGRRYLRRQQVLDTGPAAVRYLTQLVHDDPNGWPSAVDTLHDLLQQHGPDALHVALRTAADASIYDASAVARMLAHRPAPPHLRLCPRPTASVT